MLVVVAAVQGLVDTTVDSVDTTVDSVDTWPVG
jgi:hypothetical protein